MWIRNKVTNTLQEIHNADVIKICQKEPEKYELSEEYPLYGKATEKKTEEKSEMGDKESNENAVTQSETGTAEDGNSANPDNYADMKINDLKKIAKEKGIQGYNNMDKTTLVAVIQAH